MTYSSNSQAELAHGVQSWWTPIENFLHKLGNSGACSPIFRELGNLLMCWDLASDEKPEEALREWLGTARSFG